MTPTYWSRHKTIPGKGHSLWKRGGFNPVAPVPDVEITSFSPTSGPVTTVVTVNGTGFTAPTVVVTDVKFNGTSASSFSVISNTVIHATVDTGSTTGVIEIDYDFSTGNGIVDSSGLTPSDFTVA